jgi:hypothetical protein
MQDIKREYREWVNANKRLQYEVEKLKLQMAFIKSDSH